MHELESAILLNMVPTERPRVAIATGTGRYADPWHPYPATSARIATILRADGWDAHVDPDVDHALAHLDGVDLLFVNAGDPWRSGGEPFVDPAASAGLIAAIARGIGLVGVHAALSTLRDHPAWREAIGGEWVPGASWHPPLGDARVRIVDADHEITAGMPHLDVFDERYCDLVVDADARVLAVHEVDGAEHPAVWVREHPTRAVACSLGHDERAYDSPALAALLRRAARWAARR